MKLIYKTNKVVKAKFLNNYLICGNVSKAARITCKELGDDDSAPMQWNSLRSHHYYWLERDPEYAAVCKDVLEIRLDGFEEALDDNIKAKKETSIIYALNCLGQSRGYGNFQKMQFSGGLNVKVTDTPSSEESRKLSNELLLALQKERLANEQPDN